MPTQAFLARLTPDDALDLAQWMRDWRRTLYMEPSSVRDRDVVAWQEFAKQCPDFLMVKAPSSQNIGFVYFYAYNDDPHALEIAYYRKPLPPEERAGLAPHFMVKAIRSACQQMFAAYPTIQHIYASVVEANVRSVQVAEVVGFRRLGQVGLFSLYAFLETPDTPKRLFSVYMPCNPRRAHSIQTRPPARRCWMRLHRARRVVYADILFVLDRT